MTDISQFSDEEIMYFPSHSRVTGTVINPELEVSIDAKFDSLEPERKAEVAMALRREGLKRIIDSMGGDSSKAAIDSIISGITSDIVTNSFSFSRPSYGAPATSTTMLPGLFILYGDAQSGKSFVLSDIHKRLLDQKADVVYQIAGEPDHRAIQGWEPLKHIIMHGYDDGAPSVLLIDSLKDALYSSKGGLTSGGVSTQFIVDLSSLSASLMADGRTVIAVINPSQKKLLDDLYETIKSNVTGILHLRNNEAFAGSLRVWHQDGYYERIDRPSIDSLFKGSSSEALYSASSIVPSNRPRVIHDRLANLILNTTPRNS